MLTRGAPARRPARKILTRPAAEAPHLRGPPARQPSRGCVRVACGTQGSPRQGPRYVRPQGPTRRGVWRAYPPRDGTHACGGVAWTRTSGSSGLKIADSHRNVATRVHTKRVAPFLPIFLVRTALHCSSSRPTDSAPYLLPPRLLPPRQLARLLRCTCVCVVAVLPCRSKCDVDPVGARRPIVAGSLPLTPPPPLPSSTPPWTAACVGLPPAAVAAATFPPTVFRGPYQPLYDGGPFRGAAPRRQAHISWTLLPPPPVVAPPHREQIAPSRCPSSPPHRWHPPPPQSRSCPGSHRPCCLTRRRPRHAAVATPTAVVQRAATGCRRTAVG